ncbi:crystal protein [Huso huso]|uniref:Carboxylic ester hydrolase n=1 Tax=Huso huso TaxID=61971 RepID=A0ABR0ZV68_HUSHU
MGGDVPWTFLAVTVAVAVAATSVAASTTASKTNGKVLKHGYFGRTEGAFSETVPKDGPKVKTKSGTVEGLASDKAQIFYGIPYAAPPIKAGRWKAPGSPTPWKGVYNATYPRAACMQSCRGPFGAPAENRNCPVKLSEDCLYLNIFVPLDVNFTAPPAKLLPVMVWVHGGDFIAGTASNPMYDGRFLASSTHTIIVNVEYRLGVFGFLVTGTDPEKSATGNYGILDQQAALIWVQQNIAGFGGDPSKVTIFGESSGSQSVGLHLMVESSGPLFNQAIMQSLPFTVPLKSKHEALKLGKDFAEIANCTSTGMSCLLSLTPEKVLAAQIGAGRKILNPFKFLEKFQTWGPFIDGTLIREQITPAFRMGHWQKEKPVILGTTSEEGVMFVYGAFKKPMSLLECTACATAIFKQYALLVLYKYLPHYPEEDRRKLLSQTVTDYVFLCSSRKSARAAVKDGSAVWLYVFDHVTSDRRVWGDVTFCYDHVCHSAELPFVFSSFSMRNFTFTAEEQVLANQIVCYWGRFSHSGNPNAEGDQTEFCRQQKLPSWPEYTDRGHWLHMNLTTGSHSQMGYRDDFCNFWDTLDIY